MARRQRVSVRGAGNVGGAAAAELRDFANQVNRFGQSLQNFAEIKRKAEIDEYERVSAVQELIGTDLGSLQDTLNKRVNEGDLPEGANPVNNIGRGVLAVQNAVALNARGELYGKFNELTSAEATPEQAQQVFQETLRKHVRPDMSRTEQMAFIESSAALQKEFLSKVTVAQYESRANATRLEASIQADHFLSAYEPNMGEEALVSFQQEQKQILDNFRAIGVKDSNKFYVEQVALPHIQELADNDPEKAKALLETVRQLDITGKGGTLGNIGQFKGQFEKVEDFILRKEFESDEVLELQAIKQKDTLAKDNMLRTLVQLESDTSDAKEFRIQAEDWFTQTYGKDPMNAFRRAQFDAQMDTFQADMGQDYADNMAKRLLLGDDPDEIARDVQEEVDLGNLNARTAENLLARTEAYSAMREPVQELVGTFMGEVDLSLRTGVEEALAELDTDIAKQAITASSSQMEMLIDQQQETFNKEARYQLERLQKASGQPVTEFYSNIPELEAAVEAVHKRLQPQFAKEHQGLVRSMARDANKEQAELDASGFSGFWDRITGGTSGSKARALTGEFTKEDRDRLISEEISILRRPASAPISGFTEEQAKAKVLDLRKYSGYTPQEVLSNRTSTGMAFDPATDIDPRQVPLFRSMDDLRATPDTMIDRLAESFGVTRDELLINQGALLKRRGEG